MFEVFWDDIELKQNRQKTQKDDNQVFQKNRKKMQDYINPYWTN